MHSETRASLITGCSILTPLERIEGHVIVLREGRIDSLETAADRPVPEEMEHHSFEGCLAVPGFIDIHFHGGEGANFTTAAPDAITKALAAHLHMGTTSCLPTLMTAPEWVTLKAMASLREAGSSTGMIPEILGLNLEGPFISQEKRGVHEKSFIRSLTPAEIDTFLEASGGTVRIVTVAPEKEGALELIGYLASKGIIASAGHTNADFDQMMGAVDKGITLATHLFNAMRGIMQREPGAAGALLVHKDVFVELIADGEHVHPALFSLVARVKDPGHIILITDATSDYGLKTVASRTEKGVLMGSNKPLPGALKLFLEHADLTLEEGLRTITLNPAKLLGLQQRLGCIHPGADADIVIVDGDLDVKAVFLKGRRVR